MVFHIVGIGENITLRKATITVVGIDKGITERMVMFRIVQHHVLGIGGGILPAGGGTVLPGEVPLHLDIAGFAEFAGSNLVNREVFQRVHGIVSIGLGGSVKDLVIYTYLGRSGGLEQELHRAEGLHIPAIRGNSHLGGDLLGNGFNGAVASFVLNVHHLRSGRNGHFRIAVVTRRGCTAKQVTNLFGNVGRLRRIVVFLAGCHRKDGTEQRQSTQKKLSHSLIHIKFYSAYSAAAAAGAGAASLAGLPSMEDMTADTLLKAASSITWHLPVKRASSSTWKRWK